MPPVFFDASLVPAATSGRQQAAGKTPQNAPKGTGRLKQTGTQKLGALRAKAQHATGKHTGADAMGIAFDLQMLGACLTAGLSPATAVATVATSSAEPAWQLVSTLMNMGAPEHRAWTPLLKNPHCREIVALARASGRTGAGLQQGCNRIANELLQQQQHAATAQAQRAGVLIAMPLTMCFLPAFFLLGLLPVVLDLGMELFGGLELDAPAMPAP